MRLLLWFSLSLLASILLAVLLGIRFVVPPSMPSGFYRDVPLTGAFKKGDVITFDVPENVKELVIERKYNFSNPMPLTKTIGATAGDEVCILNDSVTINGTWYAEIFNVDSKGRLLPRLFDGCHVLSEGEIFPVSNHYSHSFDGRYFGTIPESAIRAKSVPLWILYP